jgi:hypothetical protein
METIQVKFANQNIELICNDKERVTILATKINDRLQAIQQSHPHSHSLQLSFYIALTLQNEVEMLTSQLGECKKNHAIQESTRKNTILQQQNEKNTELETIICQLIDCMTNSAIKLEKIEQ